MKFLLCLQFHEADKATAMRLARFIADLEPMMREDVEFVFVARFDCAHDYETIDYVAQKFKVNWIATYPKWTGWPAGPNGMAKDTLGWIADHRKDSPGALMIEPDCVPVKLDWLDRIISEWNLYQGEVAQMGAWRPSGGEHGHVNGNCVIHPHWAGSMSAAITEHLAWDCEIAPWVRHRWRKVALIRNCFESKNATAKDLFWAPIGELAPALVHGFKDDSAYNLARKNLLEPDTTPLSYDDIPRS